MRVVLHVGPGKTGTTALQQALADNRPGLRERRVLYPIGNYPYDAQAHHPLAILTLDPDHQQIWNIEHYGRDANDRRRRCLAYWGSIVREVRSVRPDVLILSSEFFSLASREHEWQGLRDLVSTVSDDIDVSFYVRDPADFWLSRMQQNMRFRRTPLPLYRASVRGRIEQIEDVFGRRPCVRPFSRPLLHDGDIVSDFTRTFLSLDPAELPHRPSTQNESLSPEALSILTDFQRWRPGNRERSDQRLVGRLIKDLTEVEAAMGASRRLSLTPGIRHEIIAAATDLPWLRGRFGFVLPGIDYAQAFSADALRARTIDRAEDVVDVDPERRAELHARLLETTLSTRRWGRVARDAATAVTPASLLRDPIGGGNAYDRAILRARTLRRVAQAGRQSGWRP